MNADLLQRAIEQTSCMMHANYCRRDVDEVLSFLSEDATWIGPGEQELLFSLPKISDYLRRGKKLIPYCEIVDEDIHALDCGEQCCVVMGIMTIRSREESRMVVESCQRISFVFRLFGTELKLVHAHASNPYADMVGEEYFPRAVGTQSYQYLQRMLREKTEVINMINDNITGGLKGSNDDETFSYFYVNEGLPKMLGYTHDEFLGMSGGTAVGAVYPPDLAGALQDCADCFAKGPVYNTEYRIEKKDGSLMWVLDTGRKAPDSEGVTKINSILMDITPLKTALFELEVERERYRIALGNITDVMFEYDIKKDLYVTFQRVAVGGNPELDRLEIANFSEVLQETEPAHTADVQQILGVLRGEISSPIEVRAKDFHSGGDWRLSQIRCSVICDSEHTPVKTIGLMKDVTEEKEKESALIEQAQHDGLTHLLNQGALKSAAQGYLDEPQEERGGLGALLLLDLDHFKLVNDTLGHLFGNNVLIETARVLNQSAAEEDYVGRVGGDEFVIFMKHTSKIEVIRRVKGILPGVAAASKNDKVEISCCIGVTMFSAASHSFDSLFQMADDSLYLAKSRGRGSWEMSMDGVM